MLLTPAQAALLVPRYRTYTVVCAATTTQTGTLTKTRTVVIAAAATLTHTGTLTRTPTWIAHPDTALHIGSPQPKWVAAPTPGDPMRISTTSLEYVRLHVTASTGGQPIDPTSLTIEMAFPTPGVAPVAGDWKPATWDTDTIGSTTRHLAQCLVGPAGTVTLGAGAYDTYLRVTSLPEIPVLRSPRQLTVAP